MRQTAISRLRLTSIAACAAFALAACGGGGGEGAGSPGAPQSGSKLTLDQQSAAPIAGASFVLRAKLIDASGAEIQGAKITWTSSNTSIAVIDSASDTAPAASGSGNVGQYAVVRAVGEGAVDIVASATLADGSTLRGAASLTVKPANSVSYSISVSPNAFTLANGGAGQLATAVIARSDGADGSRDLKNWTWSVSDAGSFIASAAADGKSATVSALSGAAAANGSLTACADTPAGDHICANAALARPADASLPAIAFDKASLTVKPGRQGAASVNLTDPAGSPGLASQATLSWSIAAAAGNASIVGSSTGSSVAVAGDPSQLNAWSGTLTVTATYPGGRSNSASIPLASTGPWSQIPANAEAAPYTAIAIDDSRAWTLNGGNALGARVSLFDAQSGSAPTRSVFMVPTSSGLWTVDGDPSSLMVQADGANQAQATMIRYNADLTPGLAPSFTDGNCGTSKVQRSYAAQGVGATLIGAGSCPTLNAPGYWVSYNGVKMPLNASAGWVYTVRAFVDGSYLQAGNAGVWMGYTNAGPSSVDPWPLDATSAIAPATNALSARLFTSPSPTVGSLDSMLVTDFGFTPGYILNAVPTLVDEIQANGSFVVQRSGDGFLAAANAMGSTSTAVSPIPAAGVSAFVSATATVNGQPKLRIGAVLSNGTAWVYDQP